MTRLLIVDDHRVMREGLASLIEKHPQFCVVGEAAKGEEAVQKALRLKPDVIVMDVALPDLNGVEATRQIVGRNPSAKVIGLSV